jgi:hypothetical protein
MKLSEHQKSSPHPGLSGLVTAPVARHSSMASFVMHAPNEQKSALHAPVDNTQS